MTHSSFDDLASDYEAARPRYPAELFGPLARAVTGRTNHPLVIDVGAGTGMVLDALLPQLPPGARAHAADVSAGMIRIGRAKWPAVTWHLAAAEDYLATVRAADLITAGQCYHWLNRPLFLRRAATALAPGGMLAICENDRDLADPFMSQYEDLLERRSPGYGRDYRDFGFAAELGTEFHEVTEASVAWERRMRVADFVTLALSSTKVQRAIGAHPGFATDVRDLAEAHAADDGWVTVPYRSHLVTGANPAGAAG